MTLNHALNPTSYALVPNAPVTVPLPAGTNNVYAYLQNVNLVVGSLNAIASSSLPTDSVRLFVLRTWAREWVDRIA